jgi:hypothetical protein
VDRQPPPPSAVYLTAVAHAHDADEGGDVVDLVDDAVVADADAVVIVAAALELAAARGARVLRERSG